MIVCVCRRVSDKTIAACAQQGEGFDAIQFEHGVGTQCGQCVHTAQRIWSECHPSQRLLHLHQELAPAASHWTAP
ncbi:MAG: (2Fe-2S)-binding protein [Pseudomonadota bacterium]|jgi:bacterioferritin-associated ferredoxin